MSVVALGATDVYGPLVGRASIERAMLERLQDPTTGLIFYIAEVERKLGLAPRTIPTPPSVASYRGGIDFETFEGDTSPTLIVVIAPAGEPQRYGAGDYAQVFRIDVAAVVKGESQDEARVLADSYGIAIAGCVLQHGSLGGLATNTSLLAYPSLIFPNPEMRVIVRSTATFASRIDFVVSESYRPYPAEPGPPPDPYAPPGDYARVEEINLTLTGTPLPDQGGGDDQTVTVEIDHS